MLRDVPILAPSWANLSSYCLNMFAVARYATTATLPWLLHLAMQFRLSHHPLTRSAALPAAWPYFLSE